jgi:hypothetical protein
MFAPNWSAKVEYLFVELDRNRNNNGWGWGFGWNGGWNNRQQINVVRAGVHWRFNFSQPAPILAIFRPAPRATLPLARPNGPASSRGRCAQEGERS